MSWKNWPSWLKGGVIGILIFVIHFAMNLTLELTFYGIEKMPSPLFYIFLFLIYFIIGVVIGFIIGKIKSKYKRK
ncbi:MAG: hypothetical protein Q8N63_01820 [Nanoarchaeota archaeon]|nr:hypothetical protein [Nanoarchaeota archaeon]